MPIAPEFSEVAQRARGGDIDSEISALRGQDRQALRTELPAIADQAIDQSQGIDEAAQNALIAQALTQIIPTLGGLAIGGLEGGAIGAGAGRQGVQAFQQSMGQQQQAEKAKEREIADAEEKAARLTLEQEKLAVLKEDKAASANFKQQQLLASKEQNRALTSLKRDSLISQREQNVGKKLERVAKLTGDLRKERSSLPTTRDTQKVAAAFEKVKVAGSNPSAAGDLSMIFGYMKMLDPGSTVREGEFATVEESAGVPARIRNQYNKIIEGERLNEAQRADFINQANNIFGAQQKVQGRIDDQFSKIAVQSGIDPAQVIIAFSASPEELAQEQAAQAQQIQLEAGAGIPGVPSAHAGAPDLTSIDPSVLDEAGLRQLEEQLQQSLAPQGPPQIGGSAARSALGGVR